MSRKNFQKIRKISLFPKLEINQKIPGGRIIICNGNFRKCKPEFWSKGKRPKYTTCPILRARDVPGLPWDRVLLLCHGNLSDPRKSERHYSFCLCQNEATCQTIHMFIFMQIKLRKVLYEDSF